MLERRLGLPVANYARAGAALEDRVLMVRHYAELHPDGIRAVVFGVDNHLFTARGLSSNSYTLFYPHMDDPLVRGLIDRRAAGEWEVFQRQVSHLYRYDDVLLNAALRGWMGNWNNSVAGHFNPETLAVTTAGSAARTSIHGFGIRACTEASNQAQP